MNICKTLQKKEVHKENPIMLTRTGQSIVGFGVCTESEKMNSRFISVDNIGKLAIFGTSYNLRGPEHVLLASNFRFSAFSFSVFCFWIRLAFVDFSSVHRERICLRVDAKLGET